jgi:type II secretory pathway pseudopilin PulG
MSAPKLHNRAIFRSVAVASRMARGFTAVELMNFLGLAAVLSAIGMYSLARYVRHAKTVEAVSSVTSLAGAAAEYYNVSDATQPTGASPHAVHAMRHFPPASRVSVPEDPLSVRGRRYQSNLADWSASPWRELRFSIVQPQCYQYSFESEGAGATAKAIVTAHGDLDGDGIRSTYALEIAPDQSLTAQVAATMTKTDGEE